MQIVIKYKNIHNLDNILLDEDYLRLYSSSFAYVCGYVNDKLCYILPFVLKKKYIFSYIQIQSSTIILDDSIYSHKDFLDAFILKLKKDRKIDFISQPKTNVLFNTYPTGAIYCAFGRYEIDLSLDEDEIFKNIHTKHKNVIKRAIKNGVVIRFGKDIFDDAYDLIYTTLQRNHIGMIDKNILKDFSNKKCNNILIGCAYLNDIVQAAVIIIYDKNRSYYFWGGTSLNLSLGSNNLLHFEAMKHLKSLGVRYYDFVGARIDTKDSKIQGIQRFKNRFGSTLKQGYIWKYPIKKYKYLLFTLLYRLKMKKGDIIDQEENSSNI